MVRTPGFPLPGWMALVSLTGVFGCNALWSLKILEGSHKVFTRKYDAFREVAERAAGGPSRNRFG